MCECDRRIAESQASDSIEGTYEVVGAGTLAMLAFDANNTTEPAAKQAGFAPHDLVS
jgi:hypothetical protein